MIHSRVKPSSEGERKGEIFNSLPSLSLSQTQRAQEIRSDFHVILYIFADEEEKSSPRSIKQNFLATASFVTSSTVEMFYSIWSSFRIKKKNHYCHSFEPCSKFFGWKNIVIMWI